MEKDSSSELKTEPKPETIDAEEIRPAKKNRPRKVPKDTTGIPGVVRIPFDDNEVRKFRVE